MNLQIASDMWLQVNYIASDIRLHLARILHGMGYVPSAVCYRYQHNTSDCDSWKNCSCSCHLSAAEQEELLGYTTAAPNPISLTPPETPTNER